MEKVCQRSYGTNRVYAEWENDYCESPKTIRKRRRESSFRDIWE